MATEGSEWFQDGFRNQLQCEGLKQPGLFGSKNSGGLCVFKSFFSAQTAFRSLRISSPSPLEIFAISWLYSFSQRHCASTNPYGVSLDVDTKRQAIEVSSFGTSTFSGQGILQGLRRLPIWMMLKKHSKPPVRSSLANHLGTLGMRMLPHV